MTLLAVGCSHRTAPVELREKVAFDQEKLARALDDLAARYGCEAVILSTCNRVELYVARPDELAALDGALITEFLAEFHQLSQENLAPHFYEHHNADAVHHLFRVVASLDSMLVGEGQIAGQVKRAYEIAHARGTVGPVLHALFQHANFVAKRVRSETGIAHGHVSVSSVAVDYVRQVFDRFDDKTILVIGAGKMGELTLRHLQHLKPRRIFVANRSPDKAQEIAAGCAGRAVAWEELDGAIAKANIILSTTGASEPIVNLERYQRIRPKRSGSALVILDIAVPRDFDPRIHDGDRTCLFNIDDLKRIREQTLEDRQKHVAPAEAIVDEEARRFFKESSRRRHGPVIARLTKELEAKRQAILQQLFSRLNGQLSDDDRAYVEGAFRLLQNQFLHGPISALTEDPHEGGRHTLLEALRKLFRLE
ncbi:MAG TPA: glutamyl-tRNA reductase [Gemmataceae bacterium]|jgi:glutamyl-tRNA reductase|nr:glutamyl-tRNA reductase [Gemmataceae bacterium]